MDKTPTDMQDWLFLKQLTSRPARSGPCADGHIEAEISLSDNEEGRLYRMFCHACGRVVFASPTSAKALGWLDT